MIALKPDPGCFLCGNSRSFRTQRCDGENDMNWDAVGAIGEIVGAAAVVATLGYLALQIRQNTRELRSSSFRDVFNSYSNVRLATIENSDVSELITKAFERPEEISAAQRYRLDQLYTEFAWATYQLNAAIADGFMESRI
jgi:hypothetical protein